MIQTQDMAQLMDRYQKHIVETWMDAWRRNCLSCNVGNLTPPDGAGQVTCRPPVGSTITNPISYPNPKHNRKHGSSVFTNLKACSD